MLNDTQRKSLQQYFQNNMEKVFREVNAFERALDIYQVIFAELENDQIQIARKRRKLASEIREQEDFATCVDTYLHCFDFDSILKCAKAAAPVKVVPMTIDAQEIDFQSIIEAGFVSQSPTSSEESNEISPLSNPTADADFHNLLTSLSAVEDSQLSMMQNTFYIKDDQAPCLSPKTEHILSGIKLYLTDEQRWQAVLKHDSMANGYFFYCVKSTGIYCRPTCPSRRPQRSNVIFHVTIQDAEKAGFRACRRCKPQELVSPSDLRQLTAVEMVKQEIESAVDQGVKQPSLASLATKAGMSSFHFHRVFKARTGITPEEYGKLVRSQSSGNSGTN